MTAFLMRYRNYLPYIAVSAGLGLIVTIGAWFLFGAQGACFAIAAFACGAGMGAMIGDAIRYAHPHDAGQP